MDYPASQFKTTRSFIYNYVKASPTQPEKPYILFLHGFPSSIFHYRHQIKYFSEKGYGIIAPDLLGYGKTSKPLDYHSYSGKDMSQDIKEILEHEKIDTCIGVGHDWGSFILSRLVNYYPSLFSKIAFLDIGYQSPGQGLNTQAVKFINQMVQQKLGYSVFGYFFFFGEEDAPELLNKNVEAVERLFHTKDDEVMKQYMGAEGGTRTWLEQGIVVDYPDYLTEEDKLQFAKDFSKSNGGFSAAINWYRAQLHDINAEDEAAIPKEDHKIKQPTLLISTSSLITASADFPNQMKPLVEKLEVKKLDTRHWVMLEKPDETNEVLNEFFEK